MNKFLIQTIAFLLCLLQTAVHAQNDVLRFKHLGIAEGLPQSTVYTMLQDTTGFIWIGTNDGLSRYDGYTFRNFRHDDHNAASLSNNIIDCLAEDGMGKLLVGTDNGLDVYDPRLGTFHPVALPDEPDKEITSIKKDSRGNIWVGMRKRLLLYHPVTQTVSLVKTGELPGAAISSIMEDRRHVLWLACGSGIVRFDPATGRQLPLPEALSRNPYFNRSSIHVIRQDSAGSVWIGTYRDGMLVLDAAAQHCENFRAENSGVPFTNEMVRDIFFYRNQVWVATRYGMFLLNNEHKVIRRYVEDKFDPSSLSNSSVCCFLKDKAGNVWVGTYSGGINVEYPGNDNFSYINELFNKGEGLSNKVISGIVEDNKQNIWISTEGGGVNYFNKKNNSFKYIHINPAARNVNYEFARAIALEDENNLWIGTLGGLFLYNIPSGKAQPVELRAPGENGSRIHVPVSLVKDENGMWIGTLNGLFYREKNGTLHAYFHEAGRKNSLTDNYIIKVFRDSRGGVWIGTAKGIAHLPAGSTDFENLDYPAAAPVNKAAILALTEDANGTVWMGTEENGLCYFDRSTHQFGQIDERYGLSGRTVHGIVQDGQGNLWISYSNSIAKIVFKKSRPPYTAGDVECTNYSVNNGLITNEFLNVAYQTRDGEVMFGGRNGIVTFYPDRLIVNRFKPPVVITDLLIKNQLVKTGQHAALKESITYTPGITLAYDQAYFTLKFAALNYVNPATNQYAYKLEGLNNDEQWHFVGNEQSATYTNLNPGEYIFKVKAANNDGYWNEQYASLHIRILPPLWKTWYAYLFYISIMGGLLYLFYSYSIKTARLKNELVIEQIRNEQKEELAKRKLNFFTNISHEIKTPLTLILAPIEKLLGEWQQEQRLNEQLLLMQRNGERLMRLMDQLLDFRKFEEGSMQLQAAQGDMVAFVKEVTGAFDGLARRRNIRLLFSAEQDVMQLWFDRDKFEKILYNLLSNSLKFTRPGGRVLVSLKMLYTGQHPLLALSVEDNGVGIAAENLDKIFEQFQHYDNTGLRVGGSGIGLAFTKGLVALHHGSLDVISRQAAPGEEGYTCFTVTLPAGSEHLSPGEILQACEPAGTLSAAVYQDAMPIYEAGEATVTEDACSDKPLLLVVEDEPEVLAFIAGHYNERFRVHTAADGRQGMEMAIRLMPDIIISDVMMPGMNGMEMCRLLQKDIRTSHIPIILLTARNARQHRIAGFEQGADDYITKPFSISLMDTRIHNLLESRRVLRERYSKNVTLQPKNISISGPDEQFLDAIMHYIDDNIMEPTLNVEALGQVVNMSRMTLYRKIKALTNQSALEFIRSFRLKRAAQLLERNEFTVNEVAYMVGFADVDYFRKWFKKEFGQTPTEYVSAHCSGK